MGKTEPDDTQALERSKASAVTFAGPEEDTNGVPPAAGGTGGGSGWASATDNGKQTTGQLPQPGRAGGRLSAD